MILFISSKYGNRADAVSLIQAARQRGIRTNTLLNTWDTDQTDVSNTLHNSTLGAVYGEPAFCEFIAQEMHWDLCSNSVDWITKLHNAFVKREVYCLTLEQLARIEGHHRSVLGKKIIESIDDVYFQTGIYNKFPDVPLKTNILVHTDVEWIVKYRFVIVDGKIETYSCYRIANVFNDPTIHKTVFVGKKITAEQFVCAVLEATNTATSCVIDVGFIKDLGWAVCGTYPIWSSELYGCNPDKFLKGIFAACRSLK